MKVQHLNKRAAGGRLRAVAQSGFTKLLADCSTCFDLGEFERSLLGFHRTATSASNCLPNGLASVPGDDSDIALEHSAGCGHYARLDGLVALRFFERHGGLRIDCGGILA